jgi:hypothetical protein
MKCGTVAGKQINGMCEFHGKYVPHLQTEWIRAVSLLFYIRNSWEHVGIE